ncbi:hypothetical protein ACMDCT_06385 [Halomonadaceae bacterium KBTZ08]
MTNSPKEIVLEEITRFAARRLFYHGALWRQDVMTSFGLKEDVTSRYMKSLRQRLSPIIDPEQSHRKLTLAPECALFSGFNKHLPTLAPWVEGRRLLNQVMQSHYSLLEDDRFGVKVQFDAAWSSKMINAEHDNTATTELPKDERIDYTAAVRALIQKTVLSAHYVSMKQEDDPAPVLDRPCRYILPQSLCLVDGRLLLSAYSCEDLIDYAQQRAMASTENLQLPEQKSFVMTRFLSLAHVASKQPVANTINPSTQKPFTGRDITGIAGEITVGRQPRRRHRVTLNANLSPDQKEVLRRELALDQELCAYMDQAKAFFIRARYGISMDRPDTHSLSIWPLVTEVKAIN